MRRRDFLRWTAAAAVCGGAATHVARRHADAPHCVPPALLPAHTACYFWFGWTGAHELVLQKGDRIRPPQRHTTLRLVDDWLQSGGRKPQPRYLGELTPEPPETGGDAGPGTRQKTASGEWKPVGTHPLDRYARS